MALERGEFKIKIFPKIIISIAQQLMKRKRKRKRVQVDHFIEEAFGCFSK